MSETQIEPRRRWCQFGMSAMLLGTAFISVVAAGWAVAWQRLVPAQKEFLLLNVIYVAPFWLPFIFIGFAFGRRALSARLLVALTIGEVAALASMNWIMHH